MAFLNSVVSRSNPFKSGTHPPLQSRFVLMERMESPGARSGRFGTDTPGGNALPIASN
jgi:hypothetical protein